MNTMSRSTSGAMTELVFYILITTVASLFLIRYALTVSGMLKDPVLRASARYETEDTYYILPGVFLWLTILVVGIVALIALFEPRARAGFVIAFFFGTLCYIAYAARDKAREYPQIFCALPFWYAQLRANTTREERRRLAFMWLRLPLKTRLRYNFSHHHFWIWADLVVLGTVTQTMHDAAVEATGQYVVHDMEKRIYP